VWKDFHGDSRERNNSGGFWFLDVGGSVLSVRGCKRLVNK